MQQRYHILAPLLLASCLVACSRGESRTIPPAPPAPAAELTTEQPEVHVAPPKMVEATAAPVRSAPQKQPAPGGSVLASMPGYEAPNDPEWSSVAAGRRDAPLVDGELAGGVGSAEELVLTILDALRRSDKETMHRVRMTSLEFATFLWPEFPESRPVTNIRASDAWEFLERRNLAGVTRAFDDWQGRALTLDRIEYKTGRTSYKNFTLYEDAVIVARDEAGEEVRITFARTFVERHGRWKVYTYRD